MGLGENSIQLILKQYISNFVTYEITPVIYSIEDLSAVIYTMGDLEGTLQTKYDDISMKAKLLLKGIGGTFGRLRFERKSLFRTLLRFTAFWDY